MTKMFLGILLLATTGFATVGCNLVSKRNLKLAQLTDKELSHFVRKNPKGLIYVFSDHMPLSLQGLEEARKLAQEKSLAFLEVKDSSLESKELVARGAAVHFPAYLIYQNSRIDGHFNPGYETPEILSRSIDSALKSPKIFSATPSAWKSTLSEKLRAPASSDTARPLGFVREIPLPAKPTYFIRVDTESGKLFMSGDCVVSLESGECSSTGETWEPYPISGFNLITIPTCKGIDGTCFYDTRDYTNQKDSNPIFTDTQVRGYYQSIGFLKQTKFQATIRLINYYGFMRDYIVKNGQVNTAGPVKRFCETLPRLKLPMISKDGRSISGWDENQQKTVFLKLNDDGTCESIYENPEMLSKMDWSYDGHFVAFHRSTLRDGKVAEDFPNDIIDQQMYLMDLKTKQISQMSFGPDLYYYPHFGRDGRIYALKKDQNTAVISLIEIDPVQVLKSH